MLSLRGKKKSSKRCLKLLPVVNARNYVKFQIVIKIIKRAKYGVQAVLQKKKKLEYKNNLKGFNELFYTNDLDVLPYFYRYSFLLTDHI
ncbi:hypothetical protein LCGC14_1413140 [marine sediment metagenome]|uniref:Uncharacterized protein n=1 Tax=marine sediment metagenome TaxID=412755 RepID=A0A0F9KEP8_9ZZZZ